MKNLIFIALVGFTLFACTSGEQNNKTIYLVRHAEKDTLTIKDPALTVDGIMRAVDLATWFKNIEVDSVLSSEYKRTKETAKPLAEAQNMEIGYYDPKDYKGLAQSLKDMEADTILVVGHSDTILEQIEALGIEKPQGSIDEKEYDKIFEVRLGVKKAVVHQYGSKYAE